MVHFSHKDCFNFVTQVHIFNTKKKNVLLLKLLLKFSTIYLRCLNKCKLKCRYFLDSIKTMKKKLTRKIKVRSLVPSFWVYCRSCSRIGCRINNTVNRRLYCVVFISEYKGVKMISRYKGIENIIPVKY